MRRCYLIDSAVATKSDRLKRRATVKEENVGWDEGR